MRTFETLTQFKDQSLNLYFVNRKACPAMVHPKETRVLLSLNSVSTPKAGSAFFTFRRMLTEKNNTGTCEACGQPVPLTVSDVLEDFFSWYSAENYRTELFKMLSTAIGSTEADEWTAMERSNIAHLYKLISELVIKLEMLHLKQSA